MIISFSNVTKYFGSNLILNNVSGIISSKARIGIIGANGAGKTTLLNILTGCEPYDSGELYIDPNLKLGYLTQNSLIDSTETVYQEMKNVFKEETAAIKKLSLLDMRTPQGKYEYDKLLSFINSRDAFNLDVRINYILNGLGFSEKQKSQLVSELSGGERTRLALAKLLLSDANVLLLDEPTNHLDFTTCAWLEEYLSEFKGTVISVTHDRYYLDKVCNKIWEVEFGRITEYDENYSGYKAKKAKHLEQKEKQYREHLERRNKLQDYVAKNIVRASTSAMAKSRQKELERMGELEKPIEYNKQIHINFKQTKKSWFDVLKLIDLSVYIEGRKLFSHLDIDIKAGEKIAIIGNNGTGKTTLFNAICGKHNDYSGKIHWGKEIELGIYEQNHKYSDSHKTVFEEFHDNFPLMNEKQVRSALAEVLFTSDDIYKKVANISGGESARLQLAILSQKFNNVLMLDEPTNHLDMMSKEKLEKAINDFAGTSLIVSHDRYLLNRIPDKIIYLSDEQVKVFTGKFDDFQKFNNETTKPTDIKQSKHQKNTDGYKTKEDRVKEAKRRSEISNIEKQISLLESEITELEKFISENPTDFEKLSKSCLLLENKKQELDSLTDTWLELSEND